MVEVALDRTCSLICRLGQLEVVNGMCTDGRVGVFSCDG